VLCVGLFEIDWPFSYVNEGLCCLELVNECATKGWWRGKYQQRLGSEFKYPLNERDVTVGQGWQVRLCDWEQASSHQYSSCQGWQAKPKWIEKTPWRRRLQLNWVLLCSELTVSGGIEKGNGPRCSWGEYRTAGLMQEKAGRGNWVVRGVLGPQIAWFSCCQMQKKKLAGGNRGPSCSGSWGNRLLRVPCIAPPTENPTRAVNILGEVGAVSSWYPPPICRSPGRPSRMVQGRLRVELSIAYRWRQWRFPALGFRSGTPFGSLLKSLEHGVKSCRLVRRSDHN